MKWILIVLMTHAHGLQVGPFSTFSACAAAEKTVRIQARKQAALATQVVTACVEIK